MVNGERAVEWTFSPFTIPHSAPTHRARTAALLEEYAVAAQDPQVPAAALSGGNQQRVVVGRELDSPGRGLSAGGPA